MSVPLGEGAGTFGSGRRPTEHQLQMARIRARTTGESLAHVLSVFMGVGRYGPGAAAGPTGPEAPLTDAPTGDPVDDGDDGGHERLAPVIPLSRVGSRPAEPAEPAVTDDESALPRHEQEDQR